MSKRAVPVFWTSLLALCAATTPFFVVHAVRETRAFARLSSPVVTPVASLRPAAQEADRRIVLVGGRWRCDQMEVTSNRWITRAWIPVEDDAGLPRLVIEELGTTTCNPRDPLPGLLTRDGGLGGATLPARGALLRITHLPVLLPGNRSPGKRAWLMAATMSAYTGIALLLTVRAWRGKT